MRPVRLITLTAALFAAFGARAADSPPNVVVILADDLGWTDVGCFSAKQRYGETPNLDRLAAEGRKFTDGYSCGPNCQPTRAAMMSGQYGPRTGVYTVGGTNRFDTSARPLVPVENVVKLDPKIVTFAEALKSAGYATGHFGKWHLGQDPEHHPLAQGFDESIVSMGRHFNFDTIPHVDTKPDDYLADFLTDKAVDFIERHKGGPFLLCLHHFAVHTPLEAKPGQVARFEAKAKAGGGRANAVYAAMLASLDESVGRVVAKLDDLGLGKNTLVIFTSDNGGVGGYQAAGIRAGKENTDNAPLRGGKGMLYEGGVRVPWIARWTGAITPGTVCKEPILSVDLYPTLLELAGAKSPAGQVLDGKSFVPLLRSPDGAASLGRDALYWHFPGYLGAGKNDWRTTPAGRIRSGDDVLIEFFETGKIELYNLRDDLSQKHDLAANQPERAEELHQKLAAWRKAINAPMPKPR